jgi:hypothetical protein
MKTGKYIALKNGTSFFNHVATEFLFPIITFAPSAPNPTIYFL